MASVSKLRKLVERLRAHHGPQAPPPVTDAFALYLWDRVGYLGNDAQRLAAFEQLRARVGLTPERILAAAPATLAEIASLGGIEGAKRARHMRQAAELAVGECDGDLDAA